MKIIVLILSLFVLSCKQGSTESSKENEAITPADSSSMDIPSILDKEKTQIPDTNDSGFIKLDSTLGFHLDIKYATSDNFTKKVIYDCAACYLRPNIAEALLKINKALQPQGYAIKLFDCYRPRPYQQRLWDIVPNASYVTPPTKGSMHSRGLAVDLTICKIDGKELDMGTPYDFFGQEAHTLYDKLPTEVLENRRLLLSLMKSHGFKSIRTEWWHYSIEDKQYGFSNWIWPCD